MVSEGRVKPGRDDAPLRYTLSPAQQRSRRLRNIALGLVIGLLVVLFYVMTIAKMGAGFVNRPI